MQHSHWISLHGKFYPDNLLLSGFGVPGRLLHPAYRWDDATGSGEIIADIFPYRNITLENSEHVECTYTSYYAGFVVGERKYSVIEGLEELRNDVATIQFVDNQLFAISEGFDDAGDILFRAPEPPVKHSLNYFWAYFLLGLYDGNTKAYGVADDIFFESILVNMKKHLSPRQFMEAMFIFFFRFKPEYRIDLYADTSVCQLLTDIGFFSMLASDDMDYLNEELPGDHIWPLKKRNL